MTNVSITGTLFLALIADASTTATQIEPIIDQAIDLLNLYRQDTLSTNNLSGTAGSKTLSCTSRERGAIYLVARAIYGSFYKNAANTNQVISSLSTTTTDLISNSTVYTAVKEAAASLQVTQSQEDRDWTRSII